MISKAVMSSAYVSATVDDRSLAGAQGVIAKWFLRNGDAADDKLLRQEGLGEFFLCAGDAPTRW